VPHTRCTRFQPYHRFSERRAGSDLTLPWARGFYLTNTFERGEIGSDLFAAGCRMGLEAWCQSTASAPIVAAAAGTGSKAKNRSHAASSREF
jgi:hypothetical protein